MGDSCCPLDAPRNEELRRLGQACDKLAGANNSVPTFFLLPTLCVKALPCLRTAASCAWPLYLQLCQALICVESQYRAAKTWCRIEQLAAGSVLSKPVYTLPNPSCNASPKASGGSREGAG